ncbi:MAG: hypothetical protein QW568_00620 [Candidatus Anstonellaceae archaeon]
MRASVLILLLAVLASSASAYELAIKATISQGTLAVGTNVSVMTGGVELYSQKAGTDGYARFNVTEGSYFVILRRYPYPTQVLLQTVESDVDRTFTINPVMSYSGLFGQITGPGSFEGTTVSVYSGSTLVKKASTDKNGFYSMAFIPEGNYDILVESPGFSQKKERRSLAVSEYVQFDARLEQEAPVAKPQYSLAVPSSAEQASVITATLMLGGQPVSGQIVYVSTPSGEVQIKTDESGVAKLNAAAPGTYSFRFSNLTASTVVPSKVAPKPKAEPPVQPPAQEPQQPQPAQDYSAALIAFAAIAVAIGALLGAALLFKALTGKHGKPKHGHSHHKKE